MPGKFRPVKKIEELSHSYNIADFKYGSIIKELILLYSKDYVEWDRYCSAQGLDATVQDFNWQWNEGLCIFKEINGQMALLVYDDVEDLYEVFNRDRLVDDDKHLIDFAEDHDGRYKRYNEECLD